MKRILCLILLVVSGAGRAFAAEPVADVFREGLFEEEANRNLPAAIEAYQAVVQRLDEQRRLAATAIFRLGECYRKLGQTNEAAAAYERILREFPGEETLIKLSRQNLTGLGVRPLTPLDANTLKARQEQIRLLEQEVQIAEQQRGLMKQQYEAGRAPLSEVLAKEQEVLRLRRSLLEIQTGSSPTPGTNELAFSLARATADPELDEIRRVQRLVADSPDLINASGTDGLTPLMQAAKQGQLAVARYLLDHSARADIASPSGETALHWAVSAGHRTMAELLIERGADVNAATSTGRTPLHNAAKHGYLSLAELLVSKGANLNCQMNRTRREEGYGGTPLYTAIENRHREMAKFLLEKGADPNLSGPAHPAPLIVAATSDLVRLLLDHGADPNTRDSDRLIKAVQQRDLESLRLLLEHGADPNVQSDYSPDGMTPLGLAADSGWLEGAKLLRQHGADPNLADGGENRSTPLHWAVSEQHWDMVRWLLGEGAKVDVKDGQGRTPLAIATTQAAATIPPPADQPGGYGAQVVIMRAVRGQQYGSGVSGGLQAIAPDDAWAIVIALVEGGADVNETSEGWSLGYYAAAAGRLDVLKALKAHGADLNVRGGVDKVTPLMVAVCQDWQEGVDWLLNHGAEVTLQNADGNTALHLAAWKQSVAMVERLLKAGASRTAVNALGETPQEFALGKSVGQVGIYGLPVLRTRIAPSASRFSSQLWSPFNGTWAKAYSATSASRFSSQLWSPSLAHRSSSDSKELNALLAPDSNQPVPDQEPGKQP